MILVLPDAAIGAMAELLPRKVALRPVLTGVPTEELIRWLGAMGDAKNGAPPPGVATLFRRAGVSAGLESAMSTPNLERPPRVTLTEEQKRRRRARSIAIAISRALECWPGVGRPFGFAK